MRKALPPPGTRSGLIRASLRHRRLLIMEWLDAQRVMSQVSNRTSSTDEDERPIASISRAEEDECAPMSWEEKECVRKAASLRAHRARHPVPLSRPIVPLLLGLGDPHASGLLRLVDGRSRTPRLWPRLRDPAHRARRPRAPPCSQLAFVRMRNWKARRVALPRQLAHARHPLVAVAHALTPAGRAPRSTRRVPRRRARSGTRGERDGGGGSARSTCHASSVPDVRFDQLLGALLAWCPSTGSCCRRTSSTTRSGGGHPGGHGAQRRVHVVILAIVYPFAVKRLLLVPPGRPCCAVLPGLISNRARAGCP